MGYDASRVQSRPSSRLGGQAALAPKAMTARGQSAGARAETDRASSFDAMRGSAPQRASTPGARPRSRTHARTPRVNAFSDLVERTVDCLRSGAPADGAYQDVQRILADIKKQYDDVHCEAERQENELAELRKSLRLIEGTQQESEPWSERLAYSDITREEVNRKIAEVDTRMQEEAETRKVYQHVHSRLKKEAQIIQQKTKVMDDHLRRKERECGKRQELSRRVHHDKIQSINNLEDMEQDVEQERTVCSTALDDLEGTLQQRRNEVRRREDFERWRYEVAMEAANEAFHATAGRYRKIYAIEKLTGNCLQKIIFEQAEQSQNTEDGFQMIREVTGLTDVMDIVHKFLNRDVEHEQLCSSMREAEGRLHALREAEQNRIGYSEGITYDGQDFDEQPRGLNSEVADHEQTLSRAHREHEEYQHKLRQSKLMLDNIMQWVRRVSKSFSVFEEMEDVNCADDLVNYFTSLERTVDRFLANARSEVPAAKLSKLTSQANAKEHAEQQRLLQDKDFLRSNCRVPSSLDARPISAGRQRKMPGEEDGMGQDVMAERERLKQESMKHLCDKDPFAAERMRKEAQKRERDRQRLEAAAASEATAVAVANGTAHGAAHGATHGAAQPALEDRGSPVPSVGTTPQKNRRAPTPLST